MNYTFLVTYYAHPELLAVCLDSIRKHHPGASIIVSQESGDDPIDIGNARLIHHSMKRGVWADAAKGLMQHNTNRIGIFIEHDCFLLRNIDDLISQVGEYEMIGPEEVLSMRNSPGMICQNFFILDTDDFKRRGLEKIYVRPEELPSTLGSIESGYGISQELKKKLFLPITDSGYALGTYYGDAVHHLWFGSYRKRPTWGDNINPMWMEYEAERLIKDYWDENSPLHTRI